MFLVDRVSLRELAQLDLSSLPTEFRLFKFGENETSKGTFVLDQAGAESVMAAYQKHGIELHLDYEHDQRIAAAWFVPDVRSDGLWAANVRWTPRASEMLRSREYRYFSPTFYADGKKRITKLVNAALTNLPAMDNQEPLIAASEAVELSVWSTAFVDTLPDSSFLYVAPGKKDGDGKTTPRSLRHFPVKDASGKPDLPHVRNALARIPDSNVPAAVKARITAEAERMLGKEKRMKSIVGLKDDATEDDVQKRVEALAGAEKQLLELTGKSTVAEALEAVKASQRATALAVGEAEKLASRLAALEDDKWGVEINTAVKEFRLTPAEAEEHKALKDVERDVARRLLSKRVPNKPAGTDVERKDDAVGDKATTALKLMADFKKANPQASTADAYIACAAEHPALFTEEA